MRRPILITAVVGLIAIAAAVAALAPGGEAAQGGPQQYVLNPGDTVQVAGSNLGCIATRRGGRPSIECRVTGDLERTYGTFLTSRRATVGRFLSSDTAQTVFTARHRGGWETCGGDRRSARGSSTARQGQCR